MMQPSTPPIIIVSASSRALIHYTDYYAKFSYLWLTPHSLYTLQYQYKHTSQHEEMAEERPRTPTTVTSNGRRTTIIQFTLKLQWGLATSHGIWNANLLLPVGIHSISRHLYPEAITTVLIQTVTGHLMSRTPDLQWRSNNLRHKLTLLFQNTSTRPEIEQTAKTTITTDAQNYYRGNSNLKAQWLMNGRLTYSYLSKDMRYELKMQVIRGEYLRCHRQQALSHDRPSGRKLYTMIMPTAIIILR